MHELAYVFDDIVFHAISLFDYLGDFILKCHLPSHRGKRQWGEVVKMEKKIPDKILMELCDKIDKTWVRPLSRYRGSVIHTKSEQGSVGVSLKIDAQGVEYEHDFEIPRRAYEALPIFFGKSNVQILDGAIEIAHTTLRHALSVVTTAGRYEYQPLI